MEISVLGVTGRYGVVGIEYPQFCRVLEGVFVETEHIEQTAQGPHIGWTVDGVVVPGVHHLRGSVHGSRTAVHLTKYVNLDS